MEEENMFIGEDDVNRDLEQQWKEGYHTTSAGKEIQIADMPMPHLQNAINKFRDQGLDVSILEQEVTRRLNQE